MIDLSYSVSCKSNMATWAEWVCVEDGVDLILLLSPNPSIKS